MKREELTEVLFSLCAADGTPGNEDDIASKVSALLSEYMPCSTDALGNVVGVTDGKAPRILLDAHMDRIGLVVTAVDDKGFVKVSKCGGTDVRTLSAAEVTVHGREDILGVVTSVPPHLSDKSEENKAADFADLCIDIGMSAENARKLVSPGDRITVNGTQAVLLGGKVLSPCLDDRAGAAAVLRALDIIKESGKPVCALTVLFSAQEETGGSGAKAAAFASGADEAIAVDVGFAQAPGIPKEKAGELGKGTMVGFSPFLDRGMSLKLTELAERNGIAWQYDVMGGSTGTNGDDIQTSASGKKTALLSVPQRNMHTPVEIVSLDDIEATAELIAAYILERSGENA